MTRMLSSVKNHAAPVIWTMSLVAPLLIQNQYWLRLFFVSAIWASLASGLNIAVGYTNLANLCHATFFGIGAYTAALLSLRFGVPFYLTLLAGGIAAALSGVLVGLPSIRLKGIYLGLGTIGFGQIVRLVELNLDSITNGPMGLPGIPTAAFGSYELGKAGFCYYALAFLAVQLAITRNIIHSRIGRALRAVKNDEIAAASLGVDALYYRVFAFVLSSFFAGAAGSIYAHYVTFVSPDTFTSADSITMICMVILGGAGTLYGPVVGGVILSLAPEALRFAHLYRMILVGTVMILGIILKEGDLQARLRRMGKRFMPTRHSGVRL